MPSKPPLRDIAKEWIERLPVGKVFLNTDLYRYLKTNFPDECSAEGDAASEPQFHNTARWAIQWARAGRAAGRRA